MEPIYVGDLVPSIASYKKIIEKYDKGIDRKSVVQGKSVDLGGRRIIKKKFKLI